MLLIDLLVKMSLDLEKEYFDEYNLKLKREDYHNSSGMFELLRINYQSYIYTAGKDVLEKILGQYANAQVDHIIVGKYHCTIFIKDENGKEYSEDQKTIRILDEKRENMIDVNVIDGEDKIPILCNYEYIDEENELKIYVADEVYYGIRI